MGQVGLGLSWFWAVARNLGVCACMCVCVSVCVRECVRAFECALVRVCVGWGLGRGYAQFFLHRLAPPLV